MSALSEQPPPRRGAKPGYYPDPLGSDRARWWDGQTWTYTIGPRVAAGAARGKPVPPPTKVCRRCGAQAETFENTCPSCGRSYGYGPGAVIAVIAAACLAGLLLLGGCAALVGFGLDRLGDELDTTAISRREFNSIQLGSTQASVERRLGEPFDTRRLEEEPQGRVTCLTYNRGDEGLFELDTYELCFADGRLYSKRGP